MSKPSKTLLHASLKLFTTLEVRTTDWILIIPKLAAANSAWVCWALLILLDRGNNSKNTTYRAKISLRTFLAVCLPSFNLVPSFWTLFTNIRTGAGLDKTCQLVTKKFVLITSYADKINALFLGKKILNTCLVYMTVSTEQSVIKNNYLLKEQLPMWAKRYFDKLSCILNRLFQVLLTGHHLFKSWLSQD